MSGKAQGQTRPGVNVQMTRVTDKAGGVTQVTLNTHVPPRPNGEPASVQAVDEQVKRLHQVMQREIERAQAAEDQRGAIERAQFEAGRGTATRHRGALATPERLPDAPRDDATPPHGAATE